MNKIFSPNALSILELLHHSGYEAYLVGGCVRDYLLKRAINDYDITTNARPEELKELAERNHQKILTIGIKHGTITFVVNHEPIEVTTYRFDGNYQDFRHPSEVTFATDLTDDLSRRDFTINSICSDGTKIIDMFHGQQDLKAKTIRCIGDADTRFNEDALRILRAIRFSIQLNFTIEHNTYEAIKRNAFKIKYLSVERIRDELIKMLSCNSHDLLKLLRDSGILPIIIPEYQEIYDIKQETFYHCYDVFDHINATINAARDEDYSMRLALLLHDIAKARHKSIDEHGQAHFKGHAQTSSLMAYAIMNCLKFPKRVNEEVTALLKNHDYHLHNDPKILHRFMYYLNGDFAFASRLLKLEYYDNCGKNPAFFTDANAELRQIMQAINQMSKSDECYNLSKLKISGHDLIKLGYHDAEIGLALDYLLKRVINEQNLNQHEYLLNLARRNKNEILSSQ